MSAAAGLHAEDLRCEDLRDPLGIDAHWPRLSWSFASAGRAKTQTAWQVQAASCRERLAAGIADAWDSGRVDGGGNTCLYRGTRQESHGARWWRVRLWDEAGAPGPWSGAARFEWGLLDADWRASWISAPFARACPVLARTFTVDGDVAWARLSLVCLGWYSAVINARAVGDHVLDPACTLFTDETGRGLHARVSAVTHDVSGLLRRGRNRIALMLGHGWYSADEERPPNRQPHADRPMLLLRLDTRLVDGRTMSLASGDDWRCAPAPVIANDLARGERSDARRERVFTGDDEEPGDGWMPVRMGAAPAAAISSQRTPPARVIATLPARSLSEPEPGVFVADFGQHLSGWTRLRVRAPAGAEVVVSHAGQLDPTGRLDHRHHLAVNLSGTMAAEQRDRCISGGEDAWWEPRFTLHGFRYAELRGLERRPALDEVQARVVHSDVASAGEFTCSDPLLNRIDQAVRWTLRASFQGIPQDAAERAERFGWLGDSGFVLPDYFWTFDATAFWRKWLDDIRDAQQADGDLPVVAPPHLPGWKRYGIWPAWQATYPLLVWELYQHSGDAEVIADHFAALSRLVGFFASHLEGHLLPADEKWPMGDHMEPQPDGTSSHFPLRTSNSLCNTAYVFRSARLLEEMARLLAVDDEAERFGALAAKIKRAFNARFFTEDEARYDTGSQTAQALPLQLGLVPAGREQAVLDRLVGEIERHRGHLATGIIGTAALVDVLGRHGRADVMHTIATRRTFPSWGAMIERGATTISEDYEGGEHKHRSLSMKMLCSVETFFHRDLAGLERLAPGWRRLRIAPRCVGGITSAEASVRTPPGIVSSRWRMVGSSFELDAVVPPNVTAEIVIPGAARADIAEGGTPFRIGGASVRDVDGVTSIQTRGDDLVATVGSGRYRFASGPSPDIPRVAGQRPTAAAAPR